MCSSQECGRPVYCFAPPQHVGGFQNKTLTGHETDQIVSSKALQDFSSVVTEFESSLPSGTDVTISTFITSPYEPNMS